MCGEGVLCICVVCMCVACGLCVCLGCVYMCLVCVCVCRSEVDVGYLPSLLSTLFVCLFFGDRTLSLETEAH